MTPHEQMAMDNFMDGCNCAQAVLLAFSDVTGLTREQSLMFAAPFGAGLGHLRLTCGAISAISLVYGILHGYTKIGDLEVKMSHYDEVQQMLSKFTDEWGTLICRELLDKLAAVPVPTENKPQERTAEYYKTRPCIRIVGAAARVLDEYLELNN